MLAGKLCLTPAFKIIISERLCYYYNLYESNLHTQIYIYGISEVLSLNLKG